MMNSNKNGFSSSQIAKERLKSLQAESRQLYTGDTQGYIENNVAIDNNELWDGKHNVMSSKGDQTGLLETKIPRGKPLGILLY